jgi:hypothetical protein
MVDTPFVLFGSGDYRFRESSSGRGFGADIGVAFEDIGGWNIGISVLNLGESIKWNSETMVSKMLKNWVLTLMGGQVKNGLIKNTDLKLDFEGESYRYQFQIDSLNAESLFRGDSAYQDLFSDTKTISQDSAVFRVTVPVVLKLGVAKSLSQELLMAIDFSAAFVDRFNVQKGWRTAIGFEYSHFPKTPLRVGVALGGITGWEFNIGSGLLMGPLHLDWAIGMDRGFGPIRCRDLIWLCQLIWQVVEKRNNRRSFRLNQVVNHIAGDRQIGQFLPILLVIFVLSALISSCAYEPLSPPEMPTYYQTINLPLTDVTLPLADMVDSTNHIYGDSTNDELFFQFNGELDTVMLTDDIFQIPAANAINFSQNFEGLSDVQPTFSTTVTQTTKLSQMIAVPGILPSPVDIPVGVVDRQQLDERRYEYEVYDKNAIPYFERVDYLTIGQGTFQTEIENQLLVDLDSVRITLRNKMDRTLQNLFMKRFRLVQPRVTELPGI